MMRIEPRAYDVELDEDYDRRLLKALPSALGLFPSAALAAQFAEMAKQKRALCFTVIVPTRDLATGKRPSAEPTSPATAAVLVCFHVAPALAERGPALLLKSLEGAVRRGPAPVHRVSIPIARGYGGTDSGFYREAVYEGDDDVFIAVVTHSPVEIPPETAEIVARATRGTAVDVVTTVAVTPERPGPVAQAYQERRTARPTLH